MKKLLLIAATCLLAANVQAQPWMKGMEGRPVKLKDIEEAYAQSREGQTPDKDEQEAEDRDHAAGEGRDYQFDRWRWYMQQHLDEQGYIVSPVKTLEEWMGYMQRRDLLHAVSRSTGTTSSWFFQGPSTTPGGYNGIGRIQKVAFHPTDSNTFWIASAGGGAWKTTNNGVSWTPMTDGLPVLGVADIAFNPRNPNTVYLCTGDRDGSDSYSIGLLKSKDGGATWDTTGFKVTQSQLRKTNAILVNAVDTNSLTLATSTGIYKSYNGGATWTLTLGGNFLQLVFRPSDTGVIYAAGSSGNYSQVFRSGNGGLNWSAVTNIPGGTSRVAIAVTAANPNMVKVVAANASYGLDGIYNSSDTGHTFTRIFSDSLCTRNILSGNSTLNTSSCGGQSWYDLCIAISPLDSNKVTVGGVNTYYSSNGGRAWVMATQWNGYLAGIEVVHADKHFLGYQPLRPTMMFEGNDGGVYKTASPASQLWNDLSNGLGITQFYRNAVTNNVPFVLGGAQDNGSKRINNGTVAALTGGDGMNCEIDYSDGSTYYTASQYGSINRTNDNGFSFANISNNIPGQPQGDWVTPFLLHPLVSDMIIAGYDKVWKSPDQGSTWAAISPAFSSGSKITRLALTTADPSTIYALVSNSIHRTYDLGNTWSTLTGAFTGNISDMVVDSRNKKHIWITYSGYGANKVAEYDTVNGWVARNEALPNIPVNCITIDTNNGTKYIGTDVAVFYRDTTMDHWELYSNNLPAAEVRDLGINYTTHEIWAATFGRGMWKSTKFDFPPVIGVGVSLVPFAADVITISPNPNSGQFNIETHNSGFTGQAVQVRIISSTGQTAWQGIGAFDASGGLAVHADGLVRGTYVVEVAGGKGMMARTKMVVF